MSEKQSHPNYIFGRPVRPNEFINRESELKTIFNRLRNGESTAIVGEPHIGKSSLLLKIADKSTQENYLGEVADKFITSSIDLLPVGNDYTVEQFWEEALGPLQESSSFSVIKKHLEHVSMAAYDRRSLERLFNRLTRHNRQLVLLLDEFERLLVHPNFQDAAFFALLRSLTTRTGSLCVVLASRLPIADLNEKGRGLLETGSPFFNNFIEVRLRPFSETTVSTFLKQSVNIFSQNDYRVIRRVAGRHPFLLQAMAATLLETIDQDRYTIAAETFYSRTSYHFDDLWFAMNDRDRTTAVIISLMELGGRALGKEFAYGEIERVATFGPELMRLSESGLVEKVGKEWEFDWQHLLLWQGEKWTVATQAFVWWVRDVVIADARYLPTYTEWLTNKQYRLLLTQEQWEHLVKAVKKAPDWAVRGTSWLAKALFKELLQ